MGNAIAEGLVEFMAEGMLDLDAALEYHLTANLFPPQNARWVPACKVAIEMASRDDEDPEFLWAPAQVYGKAQAFTWAEMMDDMHPWPFVDRAN